jgi:glycosyltransferase involved in cell wall biosynthesis
LNSALNIQNSKLKIAILADFPLSSLTGGSVGRGGGQGCTWLPQLAQAFGDHPEVDIHWIVASKSTKRLRTHSMWNQTFHEMPCLPRSVDLMTDYLPIRWSFRRLIAKIRPDVIHAWGAEMPYPAALFDFKGPKVFSLQGALTYYKQIGGLPDEWRWNKMVSMEPRFIQVADVTTAESPWARERVLDLQPSADCRVVDYGIHESFFQTPWTPDPANPYVLYVGGGGYRKGIDVLIDALKLPGERKWKMVFAGDDTLRAELEASGLSNYEFLGMLKWQDLLPHMQRAWCVVVPTRADTGPTVVKECRVVGLPIVGSTHGGVRDYVHHEQNGLTVDPLEPQPLRAALDSAMSSYDHALALGRGRHDQDRASFQPSLTASKFIAIYRELASGTARI